MRGRNNYNVIIRHTVGNLEKPWRVGPLNFMRKNWYYVGSGIFVVLAIGLAILWNDMSVLRKLMWISFMALVVHQFEEYAWPGGFPAVMNIAWQPKEGGKPDRYQLNRQTSLFARQCVLRLPFLHPGDHFPQPDLAWAGKCHNWYDAVWHSWDLDQSKNAIDL